MHACIFLYLYILTHFHSRFILNSTNTWVPRVFQPSVLHAVHATQQTGHSPWPQGALILTGETDYDKATCKILQSGYPWVLRDVGSVKTSCRTCTWSCNWTDRCCLDKRGQGARAVSEGSVAVPLQAPPVQILTPAFIRDKNWTHWVCHQ